jgi:outer membrane protein assembly factor BamB/tetratricopeptide (TPR) repeat protein
MRKAMKQRIALSAWHRVRRRSPGALLVGITIALISTLDDCAFGQFNGPFGGRRWMNGSQEFDNEPSNDAFWINHEITRQWDKAKSLVEQGNYSDAVTLLDEILERGEDYFFKPDTSKSVYRSLKTEAERLVGNLPVEGRKAYELQFGARAAQLLNAAAAAGDIVQLQEIARRYFHTQAGYQATLLLARYQLDHDHPLAAALGLERLENAPSAANAFEPSLSVLLATSWSRAGMLDKARDTLIALKNRDPHASVRVGGKPQQIFSDDRDALAWLEANVGKSPEASAAELQQWAVFRGDPARNASSSGGMPLLNPLWRVSTTNHPTLEKALVDIRKYYLDQGQAALPAMQPLAVGDLVLMRTARDLLAVDFESGKRLWPIRSSNDITPEQLLGSSSNSNAASFDPQRSPGLTERFWEDATYGILSSDGQQVYLIDDLDVLPSSNTNDVLNAQFGGGFRGGRVLPPNANLIRGGRFVVTDPKHWNTLAAHELKTQGKLKWRVGGQTGEDEPQLAEAFFLGAPLPLQGSLYVLAEIKGEIRLCVLNANTGHLDWSQQIAMVSQDVQIDPFRRVAGCSPSYADGVMVCPTSAGAIVAIDIAKRTLLWGYPYASDLNTFRNPILRGGNWQFNGGVPIASPEHWADATVTISQGSVIVTPLESNQLHCLSLLDGTLKWPIKPRGDALYVAGVHHGQVLVVGKNNLLTAYNLSDGKQVWRTTNASAPATNSQSKLSTDAGAMPSGRGYLCGDDYFLPLTSAEVVRVDLKTGKLADRARSRHDSIPGNLICYRGEVVSQGVDYLETFFQQEPLENRIAKLLEEKPDDPWALAHRGEIALERGQLDQAISDTRRAYKADPSPFNRDLLIECLSAGLTKDFNHYRDALHDLEDLVKLDRERAVFLRLLAAGLQKSGETLGALDAYLKLAMLEAPAEELEEIDPRLSVQRMRWLRAQFEALLAAAKPAEREQIDAVLVQQLNQATWAKDPNQLKQFAICFDTHPLADKACESLVDRLSGNDTFLEREFLLQKLEKSSDAGRRYAAAAKMAALLREAGQPEIALAEYRRLEKQAGNQAVLDGKSVRQILDALPADSPLARAAKLDVNWPEGKVNVERRNSPARMGGMALYQRAMPIQWQGSRGPFFNDVSIDFDIMRQEICGRDGLGRERFRVPLGDTSRADLMPYQSMGMSSIAFAHGHVVVLWTATQVFGIDTLSSPAVSAGRVLWQKDLCDPAMANGGGALTEYPWGGSRRVRNPLLGTVGLCGDTLCIQRGRDVTAIDPLTGDTAWVRHGVEPSSEIFGDNEFVILAPASDKKAMVLRTSDGQQLDDCTLPPAQQRWTTVGRNVLAWRAVNGAQVLCLQDPTKAPAEIWFCEFHNRTAAATKATDNAVLRQSMVVKATLVDANTVAVLQSDGEFSLLNMADGKRLVSEQLKPEENLQGIFVIRGEHQDLLIANHETPGSGRSLPAGRNPNFQGPATIEPPLGDQSCPLVSGHVYAFDRASGKLQWPGPASIEHQGLLLSQPTEVPALTFARTLRWQGVTTGQPVQGSILCLDKRTGQLLFENDELPPLGSVETIGNLADKTVTLLAQSQLVVLTFTDMPAPKQPPYQAGTKDKKSAEPNSKSTNSETEKPSGGQAK